MTGQKLKDLRQKSDLTQEALAEKLFVSRDLISKWENGRRRPAFHYLEKLSEIFSCEMDTLIERNEELEIELAGCFPPDFQPEDFRKTINSFLRQLPERECNLFVRRYYFFESSSEIADRYRLRPGHVRMILSRTRKKLKKYLSEEQNG